MVCANAIMDTLTSKLIFLVKLRVTSQNQGACGSWEEVFEPYSFEYPGKNCLIYAECRTLKIMSLTAVFLCVAHVQQRT
jgi:hypothetical protein